MKKIPQSRAFVQDSKAGQFSNIFMFAVFTFGSPFSFWVFLPPQVTTSFSASCSNIAAAAAAAKSLQLCLTLCDPKDGSPPGSSIHGILQARIWSGLPFPSPMHACMLSRFSHVRLCVTLWTAAHQAPLSMGFSKQECWSRLPFFSP